MMSLLHQAGALNILILLAAGWLLFRVIAVARIHLRSTRLCGPPNKSFIFGLSRYINSHADSGFVFEEWAKEYGNVYEVPDALGTRHVVLCDPKAIVHFYSKDSFSYVNMGLTKYRIQYTLGKGIIWADGERHKRQRKALVPGFNSVAIKRLTPIFFDCAYKVKDAWDSILNSSSKDYAIIDVQQWMNHISLDSIGIAGFSHDFQSLYGKKPTVATIFESFGTVKPNIVTASLFVIASVFPILMRLPTPRAAIAKKLTSSMGEISDELLKRCRTEKQDVAENKKDKSIIGLLINAEAQGGDSRMSQGEVMSQMKTFIVAGYETTSATMSWALTELSIHTDIQDKVRQELSTFVGSDPTYEQLSNGLPYLDAVVSEVLRLHPPVDRTTRVAAQDDIIPLREPIVTYSGDRVDHIVIAKGTVVTAPIRCINRSTAIWGANAKEFIPERWLGSDAFQPLAKEVQGYRHLLTFADGPRTCLGKVFAVAEIKAALCVLIRQYIFELRDGPDTKIETWRGVLPRPKIAGEEGNSLPLRVRRVE